MVESYKKRGDIKMNMKKTILSGMLSLSLLAGTGYGSLHYAEAAKKTEVTSSYKTIKGYTLSYDVPKNITVELFSGKAVFKRNGMVVGGIQFLNYDGKQTAKSLLPTYISVIDSRKVGDVALPTERFYTQSEDSQDYHSIMMDKKKKRAFDFWANSKLLTDKEIKDIRKSIKVLR